MLELGSTLTLLPALALCVMLGANNLSTCLGTSVGARALSYSEALILGSVGLMAGLFLEGYKLSRVVTAGITSPPSSSLLFAIGTSSLIIMVILTYLKLPISLSQVLVGAVVGGAVASGVAVDWKSILIIAASWVLTPALGLAGGMLLSYLTKRLARGVRKLLTLNLLYAYFTVASGFYSAYTLGANTLGLIIGFDTNGSNPLVSVLFGLATVSGMLFLSMDTTRSVAENIIGMNPSEAFSSQLAGALTVHGFTQFGIPVSVSQAVVGGIYGASMPRRIVVRNDRLTREIIFGWTIAPLVGAALAFIIAYLM